MNRKKTVNRVAAIALSPLALALGVGMQSATAAVDADAKLTHRADWILTRGLHALAVA